MPDMTATVIHLPTERLARRGSDESRRRHPAAGRGAAVVPIESNRRFTAMPDVPPLPELPFEPAFVGDWVADAHAVLDRFALLLDVGRADDLIELCDRAIAHLDVSSFAPEDEEAVEGLVDRLRLLRMTAWRAPRPG
jgi:hypothetical protein